MKPVFWPIDNFLARLRAPAPQKPAHYADLSDGDIARLRLLVAEDGYAVLVRVLDYAANLNAEQLLSPQTTSEARTYLSGLIAGLRRSGTLVDEILSTEQHALEHARNEHPAGKSRATIAATYATPFYSAR